MPLPDESFDLALSEHGASDWSDPYRWIPEAARLLRPGGRLVFMHATPLRVSATPGRRRRVAELQRPYFGMHRFEWTPDDGIEFQLTYGGWIDVLRGAGFEIERLVELQRPRTRTARVLRGSGSRVEQAVAERGDLGRAQDR